MVFTIISFVLLEAHAAMLDYYAMINQECVYMYSTFLFFCFVPGTFNLYEKPPDVETLTEEEKSEGKAKKGEEKSYTRKRSKDDSSSEDSDDPDLFSAFTPSQKKPDKTPPFSESLNYSRSKFPSGL